MIYNLKRIIIHKGDCLLDYYYTIIKFNNSYNWLICNDKNNIYDINNLNKNIIGSMKDSQNTYV